jgi:hypothetical protein
VRVAGAAADIGAVELQAGEGDGLFRNGLDPVGVFFIHGADD